MIDELLEMQKDTFKNLLLVAHVAGILGLTLSLTSDFFVLDITRATLSSLSLNLLGIVALNFCAGWLSRRRFRQAAWLWVGGLNLALAWLVPWPLAPELGARPFVFVLPTVVAGLLISREASLCAAGLASALSLAGLALAGRLDAPALGATFAPLALTWTTAILSWISSDQLVTALAWTKRAQDETHLQAERLRQSRDALEKGLLIRNNLYEQLQIANAQVMRRAMQLDTVAQVSRRITSLLQLDQVLTEVVNLICDKFGYYYSCVFLIDHPHADVQEQTLVLRAAGGAPGPAMLARGLRLAVDKSSLNGYAASAGQTQCVNDITMSAYFRQMDLLRDIVSELVIPLRVGEQVIGTLDVQSQHVNAFTQDDIAVLEGLADQISIAIQNSRLYESEQARRRIAETLRKVGHVLSSTLELDEVLGRFLDELAQVVPYRRAAVMLQKGPVLHMAATRGFARQTQNLTIDIRENDLYAQISASRQVLVIPNVAAFPGWQQLEGLPLDHSWLGAPLVAQDRVIGMLSLTRAEPNAFTRDDETVALTFANQAAIAIHNARLYAETQAAKESAEQANRQTQIALREMEGLFAAAQAILGALDLQEICRNLISHFNRVVEAARTILFLVDHEQRQVLLRMGHGALEPNDLAADYDELEAGISGLVFKSAQPVLSLSADDGIEPEATRGRRRQSNAGALIVVPLASKGRVIGTITALNRRGQRAFTQHDVNLLMSLATQAAAAIDNVRLYEQLRLFNQQLEQLVQQRTCELQQAYARLEHLDRNKTDFINIAAHELRTPLTVVRGYAEIMQNNPLVASDALLTETLTGILNGMKRLHEIVNSMLDVARLDSQQLDMRAEPLSLASLLQRVLHEFQAALVERRLALQLKGLEALPFIQADPGMLYKVFYHLVINAIKYTPDGGRISVSGQRILDEEGRDCVEIAVSDTGIGIDAKHHEMIFEKLYQVGGVALHSSGKTKFKGGGPGLGLAIAKGIVLAHNGKIWVESPGYDESACPGSTFYVRLPVGNQANRR